MKEQTKGPWYPYPTWDPPRILIVQMNGQPSDDFREVQKQVIYPPVAVVIGDNKTDANLITAAPDLKAVALAYEQWEADVILNSKCWRYETPHITQALWDRFIEIQTMRNDALAKTRGEGA